MTDETVCRAPARRFPPPVVVGVAFAAGAVPFSGWAARLLTGVDLRRTETGTVSGTELYRVAGFGPLAVAGSLDVAKGAVGPLLAGRDRPRLAAVAAGAAVAGHNWSPVLGGAGGRGISPALGATLATAPDATVVLIAGLGMGRLAGQSGLGCFAAIVGLLPILARRRGRGGALLAACLAAPMLGKRLLGNRPAERAHLWTTLVSRLVFDREPAVRAS